MSAILARIRGGGRLTVQAILPEGATSLEASVTQRSGRRLTVTMATDANGDISSLQLKREPPLPTVDSPAAFQRAAQQAGVYSSLLIATAGPDGTCVPRQALGEQGPHPLGSMFKLYVLDAVARAVEKGALSWNSRLTVTGDVKSLPSGQLQDAPDGTHVTVEQAAALMISISDNTAADLLIGAVGQPALLAAVHALSNTHPALLNPFLTTRQMFTLQYDAPALRSRWAAALPGLVSAATDTVHEPTNATSAARTALLRQLPAGEPSLTAQARPGWLDGVEWYASPLDICRAQAGLHQLANTKAGQPITAIMAENHGVEVGPGWAYVAFKGGSDAGVLTGSWYLQPRKGPATIVVFELSATRAATMPDQIWYAVVAGGLLQHLPR